MPLPPLVVLFRRRLPPAPTPHLPGPLPFFVLALRRRIAANVPIVYPNFLDALVATLEADPSLSTLVGNHIFPNVIPEREPPTSLVYQVISRVRGVNLDGEDKTDNLRVQFTAHSISYSTCVTLAESVRDLFNGYRGWLGGIGGFKVLSATIPNGIDRYDEDSAGTDEGTFMIPIDVNFRFRKR